mgnify:CR=1 FL=1
MAMTRIRFYADATQAGLPFIRIDEGKFKGVIFLIDTGSNDNVIFGYAYEQAKELLEPVKGLSRTQYGIDGEPIDLKLVNGKVSLGGKEYDMHFLVREDGIAGKQLSDELGFPITGMIGTFFMVEHDWIIDYGKQEIIIP